MPKYSEASRLYPFESPNCLDPFSSPSHPVFRMKLESRFAAGGRLFRLIAHDRIIQAYEVVLLSLRKNVRVRVSNHLPAVLFPHEQV